MHIFFVFLAGVSTGIILGFALAIILVIETRHNEMRKGERHANDR